MNILPSASDSPPVGMDQFTNLKPKPKVGFVEKWKIKDPPGQSLSVSSL